MLDAEIGELADKVRYTKGSLPTPARVEFICQQLDLEIRHGLKVVDSKDPLRQAGKSSTLFTCATGIITTMGIASAAYSGVRGNGLMCVVLGILSLVPICVYNSRNNS